MNGAIKKAGNIGSVVNQSSFGVSNKIIGSINNAITTINIPNEAPNKATNFT